MESVLQQIPQSARYALHRLPSFRRTDEAGENDSALQGNRMQSWVIPLEADRVLCIWGEYKRNEGGAVTLGYPKRSAGLVSGGASTEDSFDELVEAADRRTGAIADAILDQMGRDGSHARHVLAIWNRYLSDVARFRGNPSQMLAEGCTVFLIEARRRGIAV